MRLTLRKFYLRLGEWTDGERRMDSRTYKTLAIHMKDPPPPGDLFPSLRMRAAREAEEDDAAIFQQVAGALMPYAGKT
jgi:hypothetical protein